MTLQPIFRQDYCVDEETRMCFARFRSEKVRPLDPKDKPVAFKTSNEEGWYGIFAIPASTAGLMQEDMKKAYMFARLNGQKEAENAMFGFRGLGNPTGETLFKIIKTLAEIEPQMIAAHNPGKTIPAPNPVMKDEWVEAAKSGKIHTFKSLDEVFADKPTTREPAKAEVGDSLESAWKTGNASQTKKGQKSAKNQSR